MKKILISLISLCLPIMVYSQACCPIYIQFKGTIETDNIQIQNIYLPSINTFETNDFENTNQSYTDLFVTLDKKKYKGVADSLGSYCKPFFDLNQFVFSNDYFYVIIETYDESGELNLIKKKFSFEEVIIKINTFYATIEIPEIIL